MRTYLPLIGIVLIFVAVGAASLYLRGTLPRLAGRYLSGNESQVLLLDETGARTLKLDEAETLLEEELVYYDELTSSDNIAYFRLRKGVNPKSVRKKLGPASRQTR